MSNHQGIEQEAAEWLARHDSGMWGDAEEVAFAEWSQTSTAHQVAFLRLSSVWKQANRLKALGARLPSGTLPQTVDWWKPSALEESPSVDHGLAKVEDETVAIGVRSNKFLVEFHERVETTHASRNSVPFFRRATRQLYARGLAASLLVVFVCGGVWLSWPSGSTYRTAVGGLKSVPLSDGSIVTLNTDSKIRVAETKSNRDVTLEQGEAFFEVAKDAQRPFVVTAGEDQVTALGTKFSVRRDGDTVRVIVTEGRVKVERRGLAPVAVSTGTIMRIGDSGSVVQEKPLAEVEEYLSWRQGFIVLRNVTLEEVAAEFNRYNTLKIVINDPKIAHMRLGGNFRANNVDAFLRLLELDAGIRVDKHDDGRVTLKAT